MPGPPMKVNALIKLAFHEMTVTTAPKRLPATTGHDNGRGRAAERGKPGGGRGRGRVPVCDATAADR